MNSTDLKRRAAEWVTSWNSKELDKIMDHYADDVELHSPFVIDRWKIAEGKISGKEKLKEHFSRAFEATSGSSLKLIDVLSGVSGTILIYQKTTGELSADLVELNDHGKVRLIRSFYGAAPANLNKAAE